jgi:DNA-directed RNA polymerase specialized sigma24 family protein
MNADLSLKLDNLRHSVNRGEQRTTAWESLAEQSLALVREAAVMCAAIPEYSEQLTSILSAGGRKSDESGGVLAALARATGNTAELESRPMPNYEDQSSATSEQVNPLQLMHNVVWYAICIIREWGLLRERVGNWCRSWLNTDDEHIMEDVLSGTAETIVISYGMRNTVSEIKLLPLACRIALNRIKRKYSKQFKPLNSAFSLDDEANPVPLPARSADDPQRELLWTAQRILCSLGPECRALLYLTCVEEEEISQIAAGLNWMFRRDHPVSAERWRQLRKGCCKELRRRVEL